MFGTFDSIVSHISSALCIVLWKSLGTADKIAWLCLLLLFLFFNLAPHFCFKKNNWHINANRITLCDPMDCSTPGLPVHHQLPESTQTHVPLVGDAIQPSHPLSFPSPPALYLSQHQGHFQGIGSSHQVAKEPELQHQSFIFKAGVRGLPLLRFLLLQSTDSKVHGLE